MRLQFKIGNFNVVKYGEDRFDIRICNDFDKTSSSISFLKKEELEQIRYEISRVLRDGENMNRGVTTIEAVRQEFEGEYEDCDLLDKIRMKCWINHSESRHKNNNKPYTYDNYINHMTISDYAQQVNLNIINVDDLGGKDAVFAILTSGMVRNDDRTNER